MSTIIFFAFVGAFVGAGGAFMIRSIAISEARRELPKAQQELQEARTQRDNAISVASRWEGIASSFQATNAKNEQTLRDLLQVNKRNEQTIAMLLAANKQETK